MAMRLHISLEDNLVEALDQRVGRRGRSAFISEAVRQALEEERRWGAIEAALATASAEGHEWDRDPSDWVRAQRRGDARRIG